MDVIHHEFEIVSADVVIEAAQDEIEAVVPILSGI
jgi:hypothetical protein